MFALVIIRDNGYVDFMSWPADRNCIYKCIIHTIMTTTKLESVNFVHRSSLFIRQNFRSTATYIYVFTIYSFKKVKAVPVHAVKPCRAMDIQLPVIFNLATRCMVSGQSDPPTNLHPGKELLPVPV